MDSGSGASDYWSKIRDQFMLAPDNVFFNPATVGAMPKVVFGRMVDTAGAWRQDIACDAVAHFGLFDRNHYGSWWRC